jgi:DNA-binding CsgD family transcriptional regulator
MTLTSRQLQVALLIREGLRQPEIATMLSISARQVERHLRRARERTGAKTTAHLVAMLLDERFRSADRDERR